MSCESNNIDLKVWTTYHDDKLIDDFNLVEDDYHILFKANDLNVAYTDNINALNKFYCELCTLYYVWKNNLKSDWIGFEHYRRKFSEVPFINEGDIVVHTVVDKLDIMDHYKKEHNLSDFNVCCDILKDKYGDGNEYLKNILGSRFIPFCCFITTWKDFVEMCDWLFGILFEFDSRLDLRLDSVRYSKHVEEAFKYYDEQQISYQKRFMGFLGERLMTAWILTKMNVKTVGM